MSPEMAQRLLDYYPTIDSLMTVYVNPNVPVKVKELLLAVRPCLCLWCL